MVIEIDLIYLFANTAADLSADGGTCNDADDAAYSGAKNAASRAGNKPYTRSQCCALNCISEARCGACDGAYVLANFLSGGFGSNR